MFTYVIQFSESNSGGKYVLSTRDYDELVKRGFKHTNRWNNTIRILATNESIALQTAIAYWESIVNVDSELCVCPTCGNNFTFRIVDVLEKCANCHNYVSTREVENGYCARCNAWNA